MYRIFKKHTTAQYAAILSGFVFMLCAFAVPVYAFTLQGISLPASTFVNSGTAIHVSAWVPYWRGLSGIQETQQLMLYVDTVSPFTYEVSATGVLTPKSNLATGDWSVLLTSSQLSNKRIIPTIMWSDRTAIYTVLSDPAKRAAHIQQIVAIMKNDSRFSGIDIDYENKKAETRAGFSAFLKELKAELVKINKTLVCTIETRDANKDTTIASGADQSKFVNDYAVIGKECDVVRVMTYDQREGDYVISAQYREKNELYMPVADIKWVEKVAKNLKRDIPASKIELGIPTYGHSYKITKDANGKWVYQRMRSLTYAQFMERSVLYGQAPTRNSAGELSFIYTITSGDLAGSYYASISDAQAVKAKVRLAETMGLRGVALFSLSGENDPQMRYEI
jgi:spore germination protein YaaH